MRAGSSFRRPNLGQVLLSATFLTAALGTAVAFGHVSDDSRARALKARPGPYIGVVEKKIDPIRDAFVDAFYSGNAPDFEEMKKLVKKRDAELLSLNCRLGAESWSYVYNGNDSNVVISVTGPYNNCLR